MGLTPITSTVFLIAKSLQPKSISQEYSRCFGELDVPAVSALRLAIVVVEQRWSIIGWVTKIYYLQFLRASEGTLCW
jgi:hypothetical protein